MKLEPTRWEATSTPGLYVRQPGGGFYARITLDGKRSWRSLIPGKVPNKERTLPTREQLEEMIRVIQKKYPRYGHRSAFTVRFLAFSGMRLDEAKHVKWKDVADGRYAIARTT